MDRERFMKTVRDYIKDAKLLHHFSDDPDELAELYVDMHGRLFVENEETPFMVSQVKDIQFQNASDVHIDDNYVLIIFDNDDYLMLKGSGEFCAAIDRKKYVNKEQLMIALPPHTKSEECLSQEIALHIMQRCADKASVVLWLFMDEPFCGDVYFECERLIVDQYQTPYTVESIQRICYWTSNDEAYENFVQVRFKNGDWIRFDEYKGILYYDAHDKRYYEECCALKLLQERSKLQK